MRRNLLTMKSAAALACGLAVAFAMTATPAKAEEDAIDTKIFRGILEGLGLKKDGEATINYQERAPLVIPPSRDLPPPESTSAAATNPAWPKDPDVIRAREAARQEKNRDTFAEIERDQRPLRPDEMTPGGNPRTPPSRRPQSENSPYQDGNELGWIAPRDLGVKGNIFSNMFGSKKDEEVARFTGEPPRASLTDPPRGYQTPSPDQPYGANTKAAPPKATNYYETVGIPKD